MKRSTRSVFELCMFGCPVRRVGNSAYVLGGFTDRFSNSPLSVSVFFSFLYLRGQLGAPSLLIFFFERLHSNAVAGNPGKWGRGWRGIKLSLRGNAVLISAVLAEWTKFVFPFSRGGEIYFTIRKYGSPYWVFASRAWKHISLYIKKINLQH